MSVRKGRERQYGTARGRWSRNSGRFRNLVLSSLNERAKRILDEEGSFVASFERSQCSLDRFWRLQIMLGSSFVPRVISCKSGKYLRQFGDRCASVAAQACALEVLVKRGE